MEVMPIDLTSIISVIMGISIVLIPVIGLTARFALKPTVEALARIFEGRGRDETVQMLERRVALLEQQVDAMEGSLGRLEEAASFEAQLRTGEGGGAGRLLEASGTSDPLGPTLAREP
jgi:hypothetical protein